MQFRSCGPAAPSAAGPGGGGAVFGLAAVEQSHSWPVGLPLGSIQQNIPVSPGTQSQDTSLYKTTRVACVV